MPITDIQPAPKGADYTWGFDTDQNAWVPVDVQAAEGSTAGNLARAAGRGVESLRLGIGQLAGADVAPDVAGLEARTRAAAAGAPIAEAVGGFAPEAAAGLAAGAATGGAGFLASLLAEAGAGGAVTALRPGGFEERMIGALETAGLNVAGGVAAKGILSAIPIFRSILGATQNRVAAGVEAAGTRIDAGRANAAAIEQMVPEGGVAPQLRSVGAAATPEGEISPQIQQESAALAATERAGAEIDTDISKQIRETAEGHGYRSPFGAGTRGGSPARLAASVMETNPIGEAWNQQVKAGNQRLTATSLADALGLPNPEKVTSIDPTYHLATAEAESGQLFQQVEAALPTIGSRDFVKAMEGISQKKGPAGKSMGQKVVNDMIEDANAQGDTVFDGEQMMQTRSVLSAKAADLFNKGDASSGATVQDAIARIDDLITKVTKRRGDLATIDKWERARGQWQLLMMAKQPGVISKQGEVNPVSMLNKMMRDKKNGGFGRDGPARGTKARKVWDIVRVAAADESGVPMTGVRGLIADQLKGTVGKGLLSGAAAGAGLGAVHGLLD